MFFYFRSGFRSDLIFTMKAITHCFLFTPDYTFASSDNICYRNAVTTTTIFFLFDSVFHLFDLSHSQTGVLTEQLISTVGFGSSLD